MRLPPHFPTGPSGSHVPALAQGYAWVFAAVSAPAALRAALAMTLAVLGFQPAAAETRFVPQDFLTIQAAVDAASDGDSVVVAAGTYRENVLVRNKVLNVVSVAGPAATIIDGSAPTRPDTGSVFLAIGSPVVLDGFTIRGG